MKDIPKRALFIHAQEWYKLDCADCPEFNFVPLPEGAVAYCNRMENKNACIFSRGKKSPNKNPASLANGLETLPQIEAL
jgi:hypothetical protein